MQNVRQCLFAMEGLDGKNCSVGYYLGDLHASTNFIKLFSWFFSVPEQTPIYQPNSLFTVCL
jgi:hypothetical protein